VIFGWLDLEIGAVAGARQAMAPSGVVDLWCATGVLYSAMHAGVLGAEASGCSAGSQEKGQAREEKDVTVEGA
jgi:hypothetical protein